MSQTVNINLPAALPATDLKHNPAFRDEPQDIHKGKDSHATSQAIGSSGINAAYVVDGARNVVLKLTDQSGRVVMQIPSEEYFIMMKLMKENSEKILLKKA